MSGESTKRLKNIGSRLIEKSNSLKELAQIIPEQSRKLRAYGEFYNYVADEYDRLAEFGIDCNVAQVVNFEEIDDLVSWQVPTSTQVYTTTSGVSGESTSITQPMMPYVDDYPDLGLLKKPPESFRLLRVTDKTINRLNMVSPGLGDTWGSAWNYLAVGDIPSIKSTATQARTVVDELSWRAPYDHLATLHWCQFDDKGKPTRLSRFAWILHGDTLPVELGNDPTKDTSCKALKKNYDALQKYVHMVQIEQSDLIAIELILKTLQVSLEEYLHFGMGRLER